MDLNKFIAEFVGTFIFLGVILATGEAISVGIALITVIFLFGRVSGGHFNPAVSTLFYAKGDINVNQLGSNVVAQVLGGLCALAWYKQTQKK